MYVRKRNSKVWGWHGLMQWYNISLIYILGGVLLHFLFCDGRTEIYSLFVFIILFKKNYFHNISFIIYKSTSFILLA